MVATEQIDQLMDDEIRALHEFYRCCRELALTIQEELKELKDHSVPTCWMIMMWTFRCVHVTWMIPKWALLIAHNMWLNIVVNAIPVALYCLELVDGPAFYNSIMVVAEQLDQLMNDEIRALHEFRRCRRELALTIRQELKDLIGHFKSTCWLILKWTFRFVHIIGKILMWALLIAHNVLLSVVDIAIIATLCSIELLDGLMFHLFKK